MLLKGIGDSHQVCLLWHTLKQEPERSGNPEIFTGIVCLYQNKPFALLYAVGNSILVKIEFFPKF